MIKIILFFCAILSFISFRAGADDTPAQPPKELADLQSKYESDLQDTIKSIKGRYIDELKALLRSELDKGDADAVVAVKAELTKMEAESTQTLDESLFSGTRWQSDAGGIIVFEPEGKWSESWKGNSNQGSWKLGKDVREAVVTRSDNQVFHFQINADKGLQRDVGSVLYQRVGN